MIEKVKTASGKLIAKIHCCIINEQYYIKNEEAVKIGDTWYVIGDPRIFFDAESQSWKKTQGLRIRRGVVGYKDGNIIMGSFISNPLKNVLVHILSSSGSLVDTMWYMNKSLLNNNIILNPVLGVWEDHTKVNKESEDAYKLIMPAIGIGRYDYPIAQEYSSNKHMDLFLSYERDTTINNPINSMDVKEFGGFSFGLEFETSAGKLEMSECLELGLIPLRDGSISGIEYSTIPMQGLEGFNLLINQIKTLQKRAQFNKECSLHVHLGGFPVKESSIWALYKLLCSLEYEISKIFPTYAFCTGHFKHTGKDYCNPLHKCLSFKDYYSYCTEGILQYDGTLTHSHPKDEEDRAKWNIHARYAWVNLINMMFKKTGKTVEFRIHAPSFNIQKIINWMFICSAILQYAIKHEEQLVKLPQGSSKITLQSLLRNIYSDRIYYQLLQYIKVRTAYFKQLTVRYDDPAGLYDLQLDSKQDFGTDIITSVIH